ncbi:hypothetical protein pb186bvf_006511 [Paramecium bursaria]
MRQLYKFTVAKQCYYKLLNLSTDCTQEEVKKAFFDLAKKYHPDVNPNTSVDPEQFRLIQEAYQTLSNEQKRKIYDDANGIIGKQYMGSPDFGDNEDIYQKYMSQKERHIRNNEDEYTEYFNRQYFKNPEYFKRKLDEDNKWNMSEQLFMKHNENIGQKKEDWILHQPNPHNHYYVHKDEFKMTKQQQIMGFFKETKGIFLLIFLLSGIYIGSDIYSNQNKGKQKIEEKGLVKNATGYRIKMMPINIA